MQFLNAVVEYSKKVKHVKLVRVAIYVASMAKEFISAVQARCCDITGSCSFSSYLVSHFIKIRTLVPLMSTSVDRFSGVVRPHCAKQMVSINFY